MPKTARALILLVLCLFFAVPDARASSVEPVVMDVEGIPRDSFSRTVTVKNPSNRRVVVFPFVGDFDPLTGAVTEGIGPTGGPSRASAWVEIPRDGFSLAPGDEREVTFRITLHAHAEEGVRHAVIAFPEGENQADAFMRVSAAGRIVVTAQVKDPAVSRVGILGFMARRRIVLGLPAELSLELFNGGSRAAAVSGTMRVFDRADRELGTRKIGDPAIAVEPGRRVPVELAWDGSGGFGRYKARVELFDASDEGRLAAADSAFFWVVPLWALGLLSGSIFLVVFIAMRTAVRRREP